MRLRWPYLSSFSVTSVLCIKIGYSIYHKFKYVQPPKFEWTSQRSRPGGQNKCIVLIISAVWNGQGCYVDKDNVIWKVWQFPILNFQCQVPFVQFAIFAYSSALSRWVNILWKFLHRNVTILQKNCDHSCTEMVPFFQKKLWSFLHRNGAIFSKRLWIVPTKMLPFFKKISKTGKVCAYCVKNFTDFHYHWTRFSQAVASLPLHWF